MPTGKLTLVAVEWIVLGPVTPDPMLEWPTVLGQDIHVLHRALGWYIHHAWVWKHDPSGMFSDWNPEVTHPVRARSDRFAVRKTVCRPRTWKGRG